MKLSSKKQAKRGALRSVRDGVVIASAVGLLAYLIYEITSPASTTRAFLNNQRRLSELSEELLNAVQRVDNRLQSLIENSEAAAKSAAPKASSTRRKTAAKPRKTSRSADSAQGA